MELYSQFSSNSPSIKRVVKSRSAAVVMSSSVMSPSSSARSKCRYVLPQFTSQPILMASAADSGAVVVMWWCR